MNNDSQALWKDQNNTFDVSACILFVISEVHTCVVVWKLDLQLTFLSSRNVLVLEFSIH